MNNTEFKGVLDDVINYMVTTTGLKGEEYSTKEDRLKNFKNIASLCGLEPEQVLFVLVAKHLIATRDAIFELPDKVRDREFWLEKTGDMVNYYGPLLQALLIERGAM